MIILLNLSLLFFLIAGIISMISFTTALNNNVSIKTKKILINIAFVFAIIAGILSIIYMYFK